MADIVITITKADVFKEVARRTAIASQTDPFYSNSSTEQKQFSQLHGESDRITGDLVNEAAKEVLRCFVSRQGDVTGDAYENDSTSIVYRFAEGTPTLGVKQTAAITSRLTKNSQDAIIYHVMTALYKMDGNAPKAAQYEGKSLQLISELNGDLYRLHD